MQKLLLLLAFLAGFCGCSNSNHSANKQADNANVPEAIGPDQSDLLKTLQGRWQNQQDSAYVLEILDTKMRHIRQGNLHFETEIVVDGECNTSACRIDSTEVVDGWCFREKGQGHDQCHIVISCDKEYLKYAPVEHPDAVEAFKKL